MMIRLGRFLRNTDFKVEDNPKGVLEYLDDVFELMDGRPVDEFFQVFPPIKRYENDGTWDYESTLKEMKHIGTTFTKESFQELLMTHCYENRYILRLGLAFMSAVNVVYEKENGHSIMEEFFSAQGVPVYQIQDNEIKPKFHSIEGGKS